LRPISLHSSIVGHVSQDFLRVGWHEVARDADEEIASQPQLGRMGDHIVKAKAGNCVQMLAVGYRHGVRDEERLKVGEPALPAMPAPLQGQHRPGQVTKNKESVDGQSPPVPQLASQQLECCEGTTTSGDMIFKIHSMLSLAGGLYCTKKMHRWDIRWRL